MNANTLIPASNDKRTGIQISRRKDVPWTDGLRTISKWVIGPNIEKSSRSCVSVASGGRLPTKIEHRSALARLDADCGDGNMRPGLGRCIGDIDEYFRAT